MSPTIALLGSTDYSRDLLALPQSVWLTVVKLTCRTCGTNMSTWERESARAHQISELQKTEAELDRGVVNPEPLNPKPYALQPELYAVHPRGLSKKLYTLNPKFSTLQTLVISSMPGNTNSHGARLVH